MSSTYDQRVPIREGMDVVSSDGDKLGEVSEVFSDHVMVQKGFFFPKDYYIPVSAMDSADDDTVYLAVTKDEALNQESAWGQRPARDTVAGTSYDTTAEDDLNVDPEPFVHEQDTQKTHINEADEISVPIHEEELVARKREVNRGEVEINKDVIAEEESVDVPVTEERVEVTRRDVDRDVTPGEDAFREGTIEVPVSGEEVDVEKRTRVTGEVDIDKTAERHTERVSDTVRREEVTVDDDVVEEPRKDRRR